MTREEKQIEKQIRKLSDRLFDIRDAREEKESKKRVGKFYKYPKNCYSCPKDETDYWPVYFAVKSASGSGVSGTSFQITATGEFKLESSYIPSSLPGYVEISETEFNDAATNFLEKARKLVKG